MVASGPITEIIIVPQGYKQILPRGKFMIPNVAIILFL